MAGEAELGRAHLHYDETQRVRACPRAVAAHGARLLQAAARYRHEVEDFSQTMDALLGMLKHLGDNVDRRKMAAIGAANLLKSIAKERESQQAKLQAEAGEKALLVEQLDAEYESLQILEASQLESIECLTQLR